ncbi:MAG TPA: amidohydrolase family protein [Blastocatellia bacterium]|nr:amidohydrolase family protein [Blastocatellia bacterium]
MKKRTILGEVEILDAHSHFFSRKFFETLISQSPRLSREEDPIRRVSEITGWVMPPADPAELARHWQQEYERHAVSGGMMMASVPGDEGSIAAAAAACPGQIFGGFMFDPAKPEAETRARRAFDELGLRVACLFPAMHHYSMAEHEGARAVVSLAAERPGTAVFVHCGALSVGVRKKLGLPSPFDLRRSNPLDLYKLAAEFPSARFILPHFGAGMFRETMMLADLCPNVYLDTSSSNGWIKYEATPVDLATVFQRALAVVGHERLLFGTDSSFFPRGWHSQIFESQVQVLHEIGVNAEQAAAILGGNLRRLLELK